MTARNRRRTDPDECTREYIARIQECYDCEIEIALSAADRSEERGTIAVTIMQVARGGNDLLNPVLLAKGHARTHDRRVYNKNVQYLLTVCMLRLLDDHIATL